MSNIPQYKLVWHLPRQAQQSQEFDSVESAYRLISEKLRQSAREWDLYNPEGILIDQGFYERS